QVADVQEEVRNYMSKNGGRPPMGESVSEHIYRLDFDLLDKSNKQIRSVYSDLYLSLLVSDQGEVTIDYAPEIARAMQKKNITNPDPDSDLTQLLIEDSFYVPVVSNDYRWIDGEPKPI